MSCSFTFVAVSRLVRCLVLAGCAVSIVSCASEPKLQASEAQASVDGHGLIALDLAGTQHALDSQFHAGRAVTLVFWQTWCANCIKEAPQVEAARAEWGEQVAFYGVVSGPDQAVDEQKMRSLVDKLGLQYPQLRDRDGSWSGRFEVSATPTVLVFSPQGELLFRGKHLPEDWQALLGA
jgi:thiol-disulfide isomerase/thioredoxin